MNLKLQVVDGHRYATAITQMPAIWLTEALKEIQQLPVDAFDELINPFESKLVIRDKFKLPYYLSVVMDELEHYAEEARRLFNVPALAIDELRHYAGVFRYRPSDYLSAHVDAGIHPLTKQRKHITALLYLGQSEGGELQLWKGNSCAGPAVPKLQRLTANIPPEHGRLLFFENNDFAWHAAAHNTGTTDRIVLTVSYLSNAVEAFGNKRERAYFVPRPNDLWTPEMYALRDRRADPERYAEVYRAGSGMSDGAVS